MNLLKLFGNKDADDQIVVVLQAEEAFWFRWRGTELLSTFVEPVGDEGLGNHTRCPWIRAATGEPVPRVRLVLDTGLDEVDRVRVDSLSPGWAGRLQILRLSSRLKDEFPLATVNRLPASLAPDVMSIVHHIIPRTWERWLDSLQKQDVCISHVVTGLELLCLCTKEQQRMAGTDRSKVMSGWSGPVLLNAAVGMEQRHLLVEGGTPLFMRMVATTDEDPGNDDSAIQETLDYLREHVLRHAGHVPVVVPSLCLPSPSLQFSAARVLSALCAGIAVNLDSMTTGAIPDCTHPDKAAKPDESLEVDGCGIAIGKDRDGMLAQTRRTERGWRVTARRTLARGTLQPSMERNQLHGLIRRLQMATLLAAVLAAMTVLLASVHGIENARKQSRLSAEKDGMGEQIDRLAESVLAMNENPEFVSRSFARIESHKSSAIPEPATVLATLARAISDYPSIVLDSLSWNTLEADAASDATFTSVAQVPSRKRLWNADSTDIHIQVEIAGSVVSGEKLRKQQQQLESFVKGLESIPGIAWVTVLDSPVDGARSSDRLARKDSSYRLSLRLSSS